MSLVPKLTAAPLALGEVALTRAVASVFARHQQLMRELVTAYALDPVSGDVVDEPLLRAVWTKTKTFVMTDQVPLASGQASGRVDLSIAGFDESGQVTFQLLMEAKTSGAYHTITVGSASPLQPAAYVLLWDQMDPKTEAPIRRVGGLTQVLQEWRHEVPAGLVVAATRNDRTWLDLALILINIISRRCAGDPDPVGPTLRMAWLLEEISPVAVRKRDGRVNPAKPGDSIHAAFQWSSDNQYLKDRRDALNRWRGGKDELRPFGQEAYDLLDGVLPDTLREMAI